MGNERVYICRACGGEIPEDYVVCPFCDSAVHPGNN